ncbi:MAG: 3-oxoacyl-ACP reductase FabG [Nitrospiraceae bacterium]|nr:MAG: 3-oxoacyl-ACP reductase FabG [Nitrospiraceae bacterium]
MDIDLTGNVALVTGAARGIGRETALLLAKAGAKVIINFIKSEEKAAELKNDISAAGGEAEIMKADIAIPEDVQALFDFVRATYGRIDILVNNAGIIKDNLLLAMKLKEWDRVLDTNLRGAFLCSQAAAEMMMPNHSGKIVNVSSIVALHATRGQANYASSKGGLISLTRTCAVELSGKGIQVNAVLPGMIVTDMSTRVLKRAGDRILERIPAGRYGNPADVAKLIVFLCSSHADYITGQAISVDGGMSIT